MKRLFHIITLALAILSPLTVCAFEDGQTVRLVLGDRSVMVKNSSLNSGEAAVMWVETNVNSQRWTLELNASNGLFYLKNVYGGYYLGIAGTASNNAAVAQTAKSASKALWEIVPVEGKADTYNLFLGTSRRYCLAAPAASSDGGAVTILSATNNPSAERIEWKIDVTTAMENALTVDKRDDLMNKWRDKHYRKASTGYVIGNGGWWGDAEMFEIVLDAYETTGDTQYLTMFDNLYKNFCQRNNTDWSGNDFNDDIAWMCIACVRAYLLSGNTDYRDKAKSNYDKMYARANKYGDGTLIWCMNWNGGGPAGTNSCINGPAAVCACYLGIALNSESYFTKAKTIYAGERALLMEKNADGSLTGKVWDSYDKKKDDGSRNYWASSYNQGTQLGAAMMLYNHYGDEQYKKDADAIMKWTYNNMSNDKKLITACQNQSGDLSGFKGILMRYVRRYAAEHNHPEYYDWMARSAYHAWNNRNSSGISDNAWHTKTNETATYNDNGTQKNCSNEGNFSCVSAAFNAHLGAVDIHPAYARTEAEDFNFIQAANVMSDGQGRIVGHLRNKHYTGYRLMKFADRTASHLTIRAKLLRTGSKINFYADQPNTSRGTLLCTFSASDFDELDQWQEVTRELAMPVDGEHDIYMVCAGSGTYDQADVDWFQFDSRYTMFADATNAPGELTTSLGDVDLSALTDGRATTDCKLSLLSSDERWVQYRAYMPIRLQAYSLWSGLTANSHPTSFTLVASNDGEKWTQLDEAVDPFTTCGQCYSRTVTPADAYRYFRFVFPTTASASVLSLSELQLVGTAIADNDMTADGGVLTEGMEAATDRSALTTLPTPATIAYASCGNYLLTAYSVTGVHEGDVLAWTLEGSENGTTWRTIDSRTDVSVPFAGNTLCFSVQPTSAYSHYRIRFTGSEAAIAQWQLFGNLDFGTFYADAAEICGSSIAALNDNDGTTVADLPADLTVRYASPIPLKIVGYSIVPADDAALDPKDLVLSGVDPDAASAPVALSTKSLSFAVRGKRYATSVTTSQLFQHFLLTFNAANPDATAVRLSEIELYASAIAESGCDVFVQPTSVSANVDGAAAATGIDKVIDQQRTTMYQAPFSDNVVITLSYDEPQTFDTYALSASKSLPANDPQDWKLEGSADGKAWTLLDEQRAQSFSHRYATQFYPTNMAPTQAYSHFRLTITATAGGAQLQLGQIQMLQLSKSNVNALPDIAAEADAASLRLVGGMLLATVPQATTLRFYDVAGRMLEARPLTPGQHALPLPSHDGLLIAVMRAGDKTVVIKCR